MEYQPYQPYQPAPQDPPNTGWQTSPTPAYGPAPVSVPPGWNYPAPPAPPKKRRTGLIVGAVGAAVLVVLLVLSAAAYGLNLGPLKDSGLSACEAIHNNVGNDGSTGDSSDDADAAADKSFTVDEYHAVRKEFAHSRYADIRDSGTKLVDLLWQLEQSVDSGDDDALGAALMLASSIYSAYSSLAGACGNHGIDIPPLSKG